MVTAGAPRWRNRRHRINDAVKGRNRRSSGRYESSVTLRGVPRNVSYSCKSGLRFPDGIGSPYRRASCLPVS